MSEHHNDSFDDSEIEIIDKGPWTTSNHGSQKRRRSSGDSSELTGSTSGDSAQSRLFACAQCKKDVTFVKGIKGCGNCGHIFETCCGVIISGNFCVFCVKQSTLSLASQK